MALDKVPYRYHFDVWALLLFVSIIIPNITWAVHPAPNDVLHIESRTPVVDVIASVAQMLLLASMILLERKDAPKIIAKAWAYPTIVMTLMYLIFWVLYYLGFVPKVMIILMAIVPCFCLACYCAGKKNYLSLVFCLVFFVCHLIFAIVNFL